MWVWRLILLTLLWVAPAQADSAFRPFVPGSFAALPNEQPERPLAVVFWSITCAPCIEEMTLWREVRHRYPKARVVMVATDEPSDEPRARRILAERGLSGDAWIFAEAPARKLRFEVDPTWRGELPRSYFLDRAGRLLKVVTGTPDPAFLAAWGAPP